MHCQIRKIKEEEQNKVSTLLKECGLPYEDISEHLNSFLVATYQDKIVGAVGLEINAKNCLLRSLVVNIEFRNKGIGKQLYDNCIDLAKQNQITLVAILTTTAEKFFTREGFVKVKDDEIPEFLKQTKEYKIYCPSSSTIMIKYL